jgi:Mrp family chromosome partitioning ATPase/capsular polysaccharide biosynthesis protein
MSSAPPEFRPSGSEFVRGGTTAFGLVRRYLAVALERWILVASIVVVTLVAAVSYWATSTKFYKAESLILVTAVPSGDAVYQQFPGLIGTGGGLTRDVETVARIVMTPEVGAEAAKVLGRPGDGLSVLRSVVATPNGQSYLVSVTATAPTPAGAVRIADAVAQATITVMTRRFQGEVDAVAKRLRAQLGGLGANAATADRQAVIARLAAVTALDGAPDPTLRFQASAVQPTRPTAAGIVVVSAVGLIVGLILAFAVIALGDMLDQRIRNERQLAEGFTLPTLARVPYEEIAAGELIVDRERELAAAEAFRTLRQNIVVLRRDLDAPRSLLFTSAAPAEGKTTCALNTAIAMVDSGYRVLLVDADSRHPNIGQALSVASDAGVSEVLRGEVPLARAVVKPRGFSGRLEVLVYNPQASGAEEGAFSRDAIRTLLDAAAEGDADFIIFDAPPLGLIADALPIAAVVDDVFITVMRGRTSLSALRALSSTLARFGVQPRGFVFIGASRRAVAPVEEAMRSASAPSVRA